jgi:hypothetical protein
MPLTQIRKDLKKPGREQLDGLTDVFRLIRGKKLVMEPPWNTF